MSSPQLRNCALKPQLTSIVLGKGGSGATVYFGRLNGRNSEFRIVAMKRKFQKSREGDVAEDESQLLEAVSSDDQLHVVKHFGTYRHGCYTTIALELLHSDLSHELKYFSRVGWDHGERTIFPIAMIRLVLRSVLLGLCHTHDKGVVHRDVKPSNIFLRKAAESNLVECVLADFSAGHFIDGSKSTIPDFALHQRGTRYYQSPECLLGRIQRHLVWSADIWGVGCVMYELALGVPPFAGGSAVEMLHVIFQRLNSSFADFPLSQGRGSLISQLESVLSSDSLDFLELLLHPDPSRRPTAREALCHRFFDATSRNAGIEWPASPGYELPRPTDSSFFDLQAYHLGFTGSVFENIHHPQTCLDDSRLAGSKGITLSAHRHNERENYPKSTDPENSIARHRSATGLFSDLSSSAKKDQEDSPACDAALQLFY